MINYESIITQCNHRNKEGCSSMWIHEEIKPEVITRLELEGFKIQESKIRDTHSIYRIFFERKIVNVNLNN